MTYSNNSLKQQERFYLILNILITNGMIGFPTHPHCVFQMPFFSIIIKEIFEWIMAYKTTLGMQTIRLPIASDQPSSLTSSSPSPFPVAGHETTPEDERVFSPWMNRLFSFTGRENIDTIFPVRICSSIFSS